MAKKKKQTIGYKYFASGHFVLCHGPIDAITKISFQDKDAYLNEENANKTIYINKPSLFGGDEQSGGVQGNIELLFGHADQQKSSVLQRICAKISNAFGGLISAYRGVCSVVFDNVLWLDHVGPQSFGGALETGVALLRLHRVNILCFSGYKTDLLIKRWF